MEDFVQLTPVKFRQVERLIQAFTKDRNEWLDRELRKILPAKAFDAFKAGDPEVLAYLHCQGIKWEMTDTVGTNGIVAVMCSLYQGPKLISKFAWRGEYPITFKHCPNILQSVRWSARNLSKVIVKSLPTK